MPELRRALYLVLFSAFAAISAPVSAAGNTVEVEAQGNAIVANKGDVEAARRRAIGDALISAALSGGATLKGHTVLDKGRITADLAILRPTGQVLSHRLVSAQLTEGIWTVRISAVVGPAPLSGCDGRRHLTVSAAPPMVSVSPEAPAWAVPLATQLSRDVVETFRSHPATTLERVAPLPSSAPIPASLDYNTLTRGRSVPLSGDHQMGTSIAVGASGGNIRLVMEISLIGQDGKPIRRQFTRETLNPRGGVAGFIAGQSRDMAQTGLTNGLAAEVRAMLDSLTCEPPQARLALSNGKLSIPLGSRHGITRASLAFVDDPNDSWGLLEVVSVNARQTVLRPLDPTRKAKSFDGLRVYFLEAGL